jgi:hypothetical protein
MKKIITALVAFATILLVVGTTPVLAGKDSFVFDFTKQCTETKDKGGIVKFICDLKSDLTACGEENAELQDNLTACGEEKERLSEKINGYGVLDTGLLTKYGSSSYGPNLYSGREWEGYGEIEGIGQVTVTVSAAWNWGWRTVNAPYSCSTNAIYTSDHHGAPVVTNPVAHVDTKSDTPYSGAFTCTSTVTVKDGDGHQIVGDIVGGSVYELVVWGGAQSLNEWLISFDVDETSGTGKFTGVNGTGTYRMTWESGPGNMGITFTDGGYVDIRRFHEQEIFLHLN